MTREMMLMTREMMMNWIWSRSHHRTGVVTARHNPTVAHSSVVAFKTLFTCLQLLLILTSKIIINHFHNISVLIWTSVQHRGVSLVESKSGHGSWFPVIFIITWTLTINIRRIFIIHLSQLNKLVFAGSGMFLSDFLPSADNSWNTKSVKISWF